MIDENKKRIKELTDLINKWNHEYFDLENPSVSDRVYDSHLKELVELENKFPDFVLPNSPTKKIGSSTKEKFKKVRHDKVMLSLNKAYSFSELEKFFNDIYDVVDDKKISFLIQPKIDGLSISLKYENGVLSQAVTRGDGTEGEDVTFNIKNIVSDIPVKINYLNPLEVRGEIYISQTNFKKVIKSEKIEYANARNLASGTLRQLDSQIVKKRNLSSFIYDVVDYQKHNLETLDQTISFLKKNNFRIIDDYRVLSINNKEEIFEYISEFENNKRNHLDYDIDGIVLKLNEIRYYDEIGFTSKFPKYSIAYKFDDELVQTILEDIFITIGRTGIVTYNAKLKTVLLKGTMVSAATLHNYNYVEELGINIGDEVTIKKAGEIIPKVVSLNKKRSIGTFSKILNCPYCLSLLEDTKTLNNQICPNKNCPEKAIKKIVHFTSKQAMNIEGLGEGVIRKFYELNFLNKIEDIFNLENHKDEIIQEKGFGTKFWFNLMEGIKNSFNVELSKLIFALGIPQLGAKNAKYIARRIKVFENIKSISIDELIKIKDIGQITIDEFVFFMNDQENIKLIDFLISIGINPKYELSNKKVFPFFEGKTFVISGTFQIKRDEIIKLIEESGGNVSSVVSKNTTALILGNDGGSKEEKAKKLGIKIITKEEFEKIIEN